jgi:hypothetical protein
MNKNATSKLKRVRPRERIKRWLVAATLLLIIASILLVEISYIFM